MAKRWAFQSDGKIMNFGNDVDFIAKLTHISPTEVKRILNTN